MLRVGALGLMLVAGCTASLAGEVDDEPACTGKCDDDDRRMLERLNALPGVTAAGGGGYYELTFQQPVDHADPDGPTFEQHVALLHRSTSAPMVVLTSGYWDFYGSTTFELTDILGANQVSIEHRYFGESRPVDPDWSKLTIEQMAHDQHAIISALRTLYDGAFITTGASKGGMTAVYHRRFYPDDVEGTVPYVAPLSFGAPDDRYTAFMEGVGPAECRQAVRDVAIELLRDRREAMVSRAAAQSWNAYTRIPLAQAVESSIVALEWSFWQYNGVGDCARVPSPDESDATLWAFLLDVSPPSSNADERVAKFDAYYFQAQAQLGFPADATPYLDAYRKFTAADYPGRLPTAAPAYDGGAAMRDIDEWVRTQGSELLFIYGEWDPWTGGPFSLGSATDSAAFTEAEGTHSAGLAGLAPADKEAAFSKLEAWTGVRPDDSYRSRRARVDTRHENRVPPALLLGM